MNGDSMKFKSYEQRGIDIFFCSGLSSLGTPSHLSALHMDVRRSMRQSFKGSCNLSALVLEMVRTPSSRCLYMFVQVVALLFILDSSLVTR